MLFIQARLLTKAIYFYIEFITSDKDSRGVWVLKSLPVAAAVINGSTETVVNGIFSSMGMTTIPETHFYRFQRKYMANYIQQLAETSTKFLREELKNNKKPLVLQFDGRHASRVCSKQSTSTFLDTDTGKVVHLESEVHNTNNASATSEFNCFKRGMEQMLFKDNLEIAEVVHDDCQQLSNWIQKEVNEKWNKNIVDSKEMWQTSRAIILSSLSI